MGSVCNNQLDQINDETDYKSHQETTIVNTSDKIKIVEDS